ncbi:MAG: S-layer homology domain-containing protein [Clostridia bacterium]|nr:S-layer homology domain-containing protein [Clostridia bacterium]
MKRIITAILAIMLFATAVPSVSAAAHTYEDLQKLYDEVANYIFRAEKTLQVVLTDDEDEFCSVPVLAAKKTLLSQNYTDADVNNAYNGLDDALSMLILIVQRNGQLTSQKTLNLIAALSTRILDDNYYSLIDAETGDIIRAKAKRVNDLIKDHSSVSEADFATEIQDFYTVMYDAAKFKITVCNDYFSTIVFTDVNRDAWFYDAVNYVYNNGLFKGTSDTTFEPYSIMTRAMFITVLSRFAYADLEGYETSFADVPADEYYYAPVGWAEGCGILDWINGDAFEPNEPITREEMVTCMYNYAKFIKFDSSDYDMSMADMITDMDEAGEFSESALRWAFSVGVISGYGNGEIKPKGTATRAEVAQVYINLQTVLGVA